MSPASNTRRPTAREQKRRSEVEARAPRVSRGRWQLAGIALGLVVFTLLVRAPLIDLPLERDEGEYAYIAWRLGFGEVPYLDWFDQKPPGIFWVYGLALALPGDPVEAIRWVAALFSAASAVALFFLAKRLFGIATATVASGLLVWISSDPAIQGPIANTELFMLTPTILASLVYLALVDRPRPAPLRSLLVGALLGVACSFKQVAAVNAIFLVLAYPMLIRGERRLPRLAAFVGWSALGGVLAWLPILGWFQARGGLAALLDAVFVHNFAYATTLPLDLRLLAFTTNPSQIPGSQGAIWILALIGLAFLVRAREGRTALFIGGWMAFSAIGVGISGYFFAHYFQQLLPPVALAAAASLRAIYGLPAWSRAPAWLRTALVGALAFGQPLAAAVPYWLLAPGDAMRRIHPDDPFEAIPALARELAAVTDADDEVFVFGAEPELLFYAQRRSASRYIFLFPLYGPYPGALEQQQRVSREIEASRPEAIVSIPNQMFFAPGAEHHLTRWLDDYVNAGYRLHATMSIEATTRDRLRRVGAGGQPPEPEAAVWAQIFIRRGDDQ